MNYTVFFVLFQNTNAKNTLPNVAAIANIKASTPSDIILATIDFSYPSSRPSMNNKSQIRSRINWCINVNLYRRNKYPTATPATINEITINI